MGEGLGPYRVPAGLDSGFRRNDGSRVLYVWVVTHVADLVFRHGTCRFAGDGNSGPISVKEV